MQHIHILIKTTIMALGLVLAAAGHAQTESSEEVSSTGVNWWDQSPWVNPDRGFNWYPPPPAPPKPKQEPQAKTPPPKDFRVMTSAEEIHKEQIRLRDQAVLNPTPENVHAYLSINAYIMEKSSVFTDMVRRVMWQSPDVDYNGRNPSANFAQNAVHEKKFQDTNELLKRLASSHGILFFYRSDCEYCHIEAPIMKMLRDQFGIEIMAISTDGGGMKEFPDAKPDNGISLAVSQGQGIQTVPALYLVSRDMKQVIFLGTGVVALDELIERIRVLYSTQPGDNY